MFALIFENKVIQLSESAFPVSIPLEWIECDETINTGFFYIDGIFKNTNKSDKEILLSLKNEKIKICKAELSKTDWQVAANIKRKRPIDKGVVEHEKEVINLMSQINKCETLEELNAININF